MCSCGGVMRDQPIRSPWALLLVLVVVAYAVILIFAPIVAIVQGAFASGADKVIAALSDPDVLLAFRLTFLLAVGAVIINTIAWTALAWVLVRHRFPGKRIVNALI